MCGIFGSTDIKTFRELYTKNSERGNFVRSVTMIFPGGMKNDIRVATKYEQDFDKHIEENPFCIYYLGHVQSPTSEIRTFDADTSHPFTYKNTYLAHNGVLKTHYQILKVHLDVGCIRQTWVDYKFLDLGQHYLLMINLLVQFNYLDGN